ncbi:hypothetical protein [Streptomyces sp. VRA16 Mangrove soil]|uniref:hypothetical protein n=1 Tax=Streptomyces sp. VRA16 Mangrove soil TaxID=2817434 RepID=UPI001A9E1BE6|nr:hypothetical protein [Streptomyces sp. VRA16 Mangrove soil]MBO1333224.1 hypothetical protein [Streptomyces sp. VRA16 Mangrove soil]
MDAVRVALLREVLAGTEWPAATRRFAGALRSSVAAYGGGLLLVGTEEYEPWHLAAHLVDEAAWSGTPELAPTLVRHAARPGDPAHLAVGLGRLAAARRGETLLVVTPDAVGAPLLERVHDARRSGATVLALDADTAANADLHAMAHDALTVPADTDLDLDTVQHLVSAAAGENAVPPPRGRRKFRDRLSRLADQLTSPPPSRW